MYYDGNIRLATIFNIVTFTFLTLLSYMIFKRNKSEINRSAQFKEVENFCLTTIVLGIFISIVSIKFNLFDRVADYFLIYILIYFPNQITKIKNTYLSILITYSLCISLILYYLIIIIYRPEWNKVYPYLFFGNKESFYATSNIKCYRNQTQSWYKTVLDNYESSFKNNIIYDFMIFSEESTGLFDIQMRNHGREVYLFKSFRIKNIVKLYNDLNDF